RESSTSGGVSGCRACSSGGSAFQRGEPTTGLSPRPLSSRGLGKVRELPLQLLGLHEADLRGLLGGDAAVLDTEGEAQGGPSVVGLASRFRNVAVACLPEDMGPESAPPAEVSSGVRERR